MNVLKEQNHVLIPWIDDELDPEFLQWIIDFHRDVLPEINRHLADFHRAIYRFKSRAEADRFIDAL